MLRTPPLPSTMAKRWRGKDRRGGRFCMVGLTALDGVRPRNEALHSVNRKARAEAAIVSLSALQWGPLPARVAGYLATPLINDALAFSGWPQHSSKEQMELMLATSAKLMEMHRDQKQLVCAELSRLVFRATGRLMVQGSWSSSQAAVWLNHDTIAALVTDQRGADLLD